MSLDLQCKLVNDQGFKFNMHCFYSLAVIPRQFFTTLPLFLLQTNHQHYREALIKGFTCPEDFQIKERSLEYSNGDSYQVSLIMMPHRSIYPH